jgi:hypothetical protein
MDSKRPKELAKLRNEFAKHDLGPSVDICGYLGEYPMKNWAGFIACPVFISFR